MITNTLTHSGKPSGYHFETVQVDDGPMPFRLSPMTLETLMDGAVDVLAIDPDYTGGHYVAVFIERDETVLGFCEGAALGLDGLVTSANGVVMFCWPKAQRDRLEKFLTVVAPRLKEGRMNYRMDFRIAGAAHEGFGPEL